jgi:hypothetical protein
MPAILSPNPKFNAFASSGVFGAGYKLYTYLANAAPTLATTYQDRAGSVPNSNPIILDARGEATIYLTPGIVYDYVLKTDEDVTVWTQEDVSADAGDADAVTFIQSGAGAQTRSSQDKLRERVTVGDNGAVGDNVTDDGPAIASAFSDYRYVRFPTAGYKNTSASLLLPFDKTAIFDPSATIASSGAGTYTQEGGEIRYGYNPAAQTSWTHNVGSAYEVLSADLGGYGTRQHGPTGIPTAIGGAVNIPSSATAAPHANGIAGYAKTASTSCGAVAIFGHGKTMATNALSWGINTVSEDNGFQTTVWGAELDFNIQNALTTVLGVQVIGGSTVEPALAIGFQVAPINAFSSPTKRWSNAFDSQDGAAVIGMQLGAVHNLASSESQSFIMNYKDAANVRTQCFYMQSDNAGNFNIRGGAASRLFTIAAGGASTAPISMFGNGLGFFGATPVGRQTSAPNATDLATAITLVNALKTGLINLGAFS